MLPWWLSEWVEKNLQRELRKKGWAGESEVIYSVLLAPAKAMPNWDGCCLRAGRGDGAGWVTINERGFAEVKVHDATLWSFYHL
jgi:hypothetical protein